jgi:streptogramin lyase
VKKFDGETVTIVAGCAVNASGNCVTPASGVPGDAGYNGDGIAATAAQLNSPTGVAVANGTLFIADSGNHTIRSVNLTTGIITTVAGIPQKLGPAVNGGLAIEATLFGPRAVAAVADEGDTSIYIVDSLNQQVRMVDLTSGIISAVAGVAGEIGNNDGPVATARLNNPLGVAVDDGIVYIADEGNDSIRVVDDGSVSTLSVGALDSPSGIAVDPNGVLYIADTDNHRVQRVQGETVTTVAGGNGAGDSGDGGPAAAAQLNTPVAVAVDATGQFLYIADLINNKVRKVDLGLSE